MKWLIENCYRCEYHGGDRCTNPKRKEIECSPEDKKCNGFKKRMNEKEDACTR